VHLRKNHVGNPPEALPDLKTASPTEKTAKIRAVDRIRAA